MGNKTTLGHLAALLTVTVWGTTFISTKVLLTVFQPTEILFIRFVLGFLVLCIAAPRRLRTSGWRQEVTFALAGLSGICLYYLLENIALTFTLASNVDVIISIAPFFTALLAHCFLRTETLHRYFFFGFVVAMAGILLISFNGSQLTLNPLGDLLGVAPLSSGPSIPCSPEKSAASAIRYCWLPAAPSFMACCSCCLRWRCSALRRMLPPLPALQSC